MNSANAKFALLFRGGSEMCMLIISGLTSVIASFLALGVKCTHMETVYPDLDMH